jgi:signal transduction histidine kinase
MAFDKRLPLTSWIFIGTLFVLCGVLGILQYRWIGEVSVAARDRLQAELERNLARLRLDFNSEAMSGFRSLVAGAPPEPAAAETVIEGRYEQWKTGAHSQSLKRLAIAVAADDAVRLRIFNWDKDRFEAADWPSEWAPMRGWMEMRFGPGGERPEQRGHDGQDVIFEIPLFGRQPPPMRRPGLPRREMAWLIAEMNEAYLRGVVLPEVLLRYLGTAGTLDYEVEVVSRFDPGSVIYMSDPAGAHIRASADASIGLLDGMGAFPEFAGRGGRLGRGRGAHGPGAPGGPDFGRWELFVRHRAGSLEAAVARTRWRNLAVTAGIFLLLITTLAALVRFTRNAQRLAQVQMDFVAGVSHELRTPLTALYTAGHNLRGRVAHQPSQVERYGEMIQQEAGRLKELVEQVLRFASAGAGRVIQDVTPVSIEDVIRKSIEATRSAIQAAQCTVETHVDPGLPPVMGDPLALKQALQNLLTNAAKYGAGERHWVGITASGTNGAAPPGVEIRVADRGPGIPEQEQSQIFEAFYRGRSATQNQIHGAGLGLNLVKKIIEAHGGTVEVKSAPDQGAEFILRLPAAPLGAIE